MTTHWLVVATRNAEDLEPVRRVVKEIPGMVAFAAGPGGETLQGWAEVRREATERLVAAGLSVRAAWVLTRAGYLSRVDISAASDAELLQIDGFGEMLLASTCAWQHLRPHDD
jgi:DNA-directed RNA polymerase alpha subunit